MKLWARKAKGKSMKRQLAVLLFALGLVAAACGGDGAASTGVASLAATETTLAGEDGTGVAEVDQERAMLDFASCLRDNGIDIDDPTVDSDGNVQFGGFRAAAQSGELDPAAMEAAFASCQDHLEGIALGRGGGDFDRTELEDTLVAYAACMRDNGYDMPDPDFSGSGPSGGEPGQGGPFGAIDRDDPDFVAAQEACQDLLSGFRGPGPGGGGRVAGGNG